jgi:hypothetical protein
MSRGTWQSDSGGGGFLIGICVVVVVVALAVEAAVHAVEAIPVWAWITGGVTVAGVLAGLVVLAVRMTRQHLPSRTAPWKPGTLVRGTSVRDMEARRTAPALPAPVIHLHVEGMSSRAVADLIAMQREPGRQESGRSDPAAGQSITSGPAQLE